MQITVPKMQHKIKEYLGFGLSVVPCNNLKVPCAKWKHLQTSLVSESEMNGWPKAPMIALICGAVSGGLQVVDVDCKYDLTGKLWSQLNEAIENAIPDLMDRFLIQKTVSGGYHLIYRCSHIGRNEKLANRETLPEERKDPKDLIKVLLETRGEGGYFCVYPSKGYEIIQGDFSEIPEITPEEQEILLEVCRTFNQIQAEVKLSLPPTQDLTPFDDYDQRGDFLGLLQSHGWPLIRQDGAISLFTRPGKTKGVSAAFNAPNAKGLPNRFNVFSTSTIFQTGTLYKPYAVYALLEHGGDYKAACKQLGEEGYGNKKPALKKTEPKSKVLISDYDPRALAKDFLEDKHHYFISEQHYYYNGKCYQAEDIFSLRSRVSSFLDSYMVQKSKTLLIPLKKSRNTIADVISQIEALTYSKLTIPDPAWRNFICLQNGILSTTTLELRPHTPDFLTTNLLDFDYNPDAKCPIWDSFLATQCPTGTPLLQEWFGLNLIPDMSYHKIFFLLGQPRTGKSTCLNTLKLLIGAKNFLASSFSSLQNEFGLQPFIGKLSAIFGDAHFSSNKNNDPTGVLERIKQISGGDSVSINQKKKDILTVTLQVRMTFAVNEIPRLNDKSNALLERLLIVKFENRVKPENRDTLLETKLKSEISGILNWALVGLIRLKSLGFSLNQENLVNDFVLANNPLAEWIDDCCEHPSTGRVQQSIAYDSWKEWCVTNGKFCGSKNALTSSLETTYGIEKTKSGSVRYYVGISLK